MSTIHSNSISVAVPRHRGFLRDFLELLLGFVAILVILWLPTREQLVFGPIALFAPLLMVLAESPTVDELGLGLRQLLGSLWILPATAVLIVISIFLAGRVGTLHELYAPELSHAGGYVVWTIYQQFLLQDYFMPRLTRLLTSDLAIGGAALLFAVAHLPNIPLCLATLVWGAASCLLFRRYRSLWVLGLAQGMLGLCFAVCVPDVWHHHMRVGLGYLHYQGIQASHHAGLQGAGQ